MLSFVSAIIELLWRWWHS